MQDILNLIRSMPDYVKYLFTEHMIYAIVITVVFVFVLLFTNKAANLIRKFFVVFLIGLGVVAHFSNREPMLCLAVLVLIALFIVRLLRYIIVTIRTNHINKRIEERALEKAARRRGSWKNKQGYSGERKPIVDPEYKPEKMVKEEIDEVIKNETVTTKVTEKATATETVQQTADVATAAEEKTEELSSDK